METIQQLFEIIIRKRQPEDLSYSVNAAFAGVTVVIALGTMLYAQVPYFSKPFAYNVTSALTQVLAIYCLLAIRKKQNRFVQTITALFGVSVILQIVAIGLASIPVLASTTILLSIWNIVLIITILRSALECSTIQAVIQTFAYHFLIGVVLVLLFPEIKLELKNMYEASKAALEASQAAASSK